MSRLFRFLIALGIAAVWVRPVSAQTLGQPPTYPPRIFTLRAGDVPNWMVAKVNAQRRESNWRARHDSSPQRLRLYQGPWASLGRTTGWYERLLLYRGPVDAVSTVLVSEFADANAAVRAYADVTAGPTLTGFKASGARGGHWSAPVRYASGPKGCAGMGGTALDFAQYGPVVIEVSSRVSRPQCTSLPDPGPTITGRLVSIMRAAAIPVVSSTTTVDGLRLFLSIPDKVYPRNALAQLTVAVTNTTGSNIELLAQPGGSLASAIQVRELDAAGQVVPAPPLLEDYLLPAPPSPPVPLTIPPHETRTIHPTIILWSDHLQLATQCFSGVPCGTVLSTPIALHLVAADTPQIDLLQSGTQPLALVRISSGYHGRLLYRSSTQCRLTGPTSPNMSPVVRAEIPSYAESEYAWAHDTGILFSPPACPQNFGAAVLTDWRLIVGWPDHSVGVLDYHVP